METMNVSVIVCTRDRTHELRHCLDSLVALDPPPGEILVVDNAPATQATAELCRRYPVRYVREDLPGLDFARNRGVREARGAVVAFADDDVVVERGWLAALAAPFADPTVGGVTGLVQPAETSSEPSRLFEAWGGFGRGTERRRFELRNGQPDYFPLNAGTIGSGCNMAFRREVFERVGYFDEAFDMGTPTGGGGDLEFFYRVIRADHHIVYEPAAVAYHRHRPTMRQLRRQLHGYGRAFFAFLTKVVLRDAAYRWRAIRFGLWWFFQGLVHDRLVGTFLKRRAYSLRLACLEILGAIQGPAIYAASRWGAARKRRRAAREWRACLKVLPLEVGQGIGDLWGLDGYEGVYCLVTLDGSPVGSVYVPVQHGYVSRDRLEAAVTQELGAALAAQMGRRMLRQARDAAAPTASVVICTRNRPADLRACLEALRWLETYPLEVLVVDSASDTGETAAVAREFAARYFYEDRPGLDRARNRGWREAQGEVVAFIDDDALADKRWLRNLAECFRDPSVGACTGLIFPAELETASQIYFERYGALNVGYRKAFYDRRSVAETLCFQGWGPLRWLGLAGRLRRRNFNIGSGANMAFRRAVLEQIGGFDDGLDAGSVAGSAGGDAYALYQAIRHGHTVVYDPDVLVWHRHRADRRRLRRQLFNYGVGHAAYQTKILVRDRDPGPLTWLLLCLPFHQLRRLGAALLRPHHFPPALVLAEMLGNLWGPFAYWRSRAHLRRRTVKERFGEMASPTAAVDWRPRSRLRLYAEVAVKGLRFAVAHGKKLAVFAVKNRRDPKLVWALMCKYANLAVSILEWRWWRTRLHAQPVFLQIESTSYCNLDCPFCGRSSSSANNKALNLEKFQRAMAQFPHLVAVALHGDGEPTMNKEIIQFVEHVKEGPIKSWTSIAGFSTNGTLLTEKMANRILDSPLDWLQISMDGATKGPFELMRVGAKYEVFLENVKRFVRLRDARGSKMFVFINFVITKANFHEIPLMVGVAHEVGVDALHMENVDMNPSLYPATPQGLATQVQELKGKFDEARALARELGVSLHLPGLEPRGDVGPGGGLMCHWPWQGAFVTAEGYVTPCCMVVDPKVLNFGNLFEQPMKEIWNSPKYQAFRQGFIDGDPIDLCKKCLWPKGMLLASPHPLDTFHGKG